MAGQRLGWIRASRENAVAHAERQLLDHRLQAFIDQGPLTVYGYRPEGPGPNAYMSPQLEAILGYTAEEWTADPDLFSKVLHPDDRDWVLAEQRRTKEAGEPFRAEYRMMTRDGRVRWFLDEAHEVAGREGEPAYHYGYLLEITDRKELEEAVRAAEERYRALVEQLPLAIYIDRLDEPPERAHDRLHGRAVDGGGRSVRQAPAPVGSRSCLARSRAHAHHRRAPPHRVPADH